MDTDDLQELGEKIKDIRMELGFTQQQFAEEIGNTVHGFDPSHDDIPARRSVIGWEKGENMPNASRLRAIAELGNTSVKVLLGQWNATVRPSKFEISRAYDHAVTATSALKELDIYQDQDFRINTNMVKKLMMTFLYED